MKKLKNHKFLFDQLGNVYVDGRKVGKVVACVEVARGKYIKLPPRGYFSLRVNETRKSLQKAERMLAARKK